MTEIFKEFHSPNIPETVLIDAAHLFSHHYGTWDTPTGRQGGKKGTISLTVLQTRSSWRLPRVFGRIYRRFADTVIVHQAIMSN